MKKVLVPKVLSHAGKWIYDGYASAWESLGYEVERYVEYHNQKADYLMIYDHILNENNASFKNYEKVFLFVTFNNFDEPYGMHENYVSKASKNQKIIDAINSQDNVVKWSFCNTIRMPQYFDKWGEVEYVPLAFDSINYKRVESQSSYDVCFVGGYANNGFNTKHQIMKDIFHDFMESGLRCGFFLNRNLSHEEECRVLTNSKVCLNIHDSYQRDIGLDINERTFKVLGLNGNMISDYVEEGIFLLGKQFFHRDSKLVDSVQSVLNISDEDRQSNRDSICANHTYINRIQQLLK